MLRARSFRFDPSAFRMSAQHILLSIPALAAGVLLVALLPAPSRPYAVILAVIFVSLANLRTRHQMRRAFSSFVITVGPNMVRRSVIGASSVEIFRHEVKQVTELPQGLRVLAGPKSLDVPRGLVGYEPLREHLLSWTFPVPASDVMTIEALSAEAAAVRAAQGPELRPSRGSVGLVVAVYAAIVILALATWRLATP